LKIIIDTREQKPLDFPYGFVSGTLRAKLDVGDYACAFENGYLPKVVFERKSISDLFGTMGKGYERFKKEIELAKELDIRLILIVDKPLTTVLKGYEKSDILGVSIVKKLFTLWIKYDLTPVFCKDREESARYIYEFFCAIGRLTIKQDKQAKQAKPIGTPNAKLPSVPRSSDIPAGGQ